MKMADEIQMFPFFPSPFFQCIVSDTNDKKNKQNFRSSFENSPKDLHLFMQNSGQF